MQPIVKACMTIAVPAARNRAEATAVEADRSSPKSNRRRPNLRPDSGLLSFSGNEIGL